MRGRMSDVKKRYESPEKVKMKELLENKGHLLSPQIRKIVGEAIIEIDDTNPTEVVELLPLTVRKFYQHTFVRCKALLPMMTMAFNAGCYIESIVLAHGVIELSLRALYVLSWQRAVLPLALTEEKLAPFYKQQLKSKKAKVFHLADELERNGLIHAEQAAFIRNINELRNSAAHGVIFGEIELPELKDKAEKASWAANGALDKLQAWFNNPQPLKDLK